MIQTYLTEFNYKSQKLFQIGLVEIFEEGQNIRRIDFLVDC